MTFGAKTEAQRMEDQAKAIEDYGKAFGSMKSFALTSKDPTGTSRTAGAGTMNFTNVNDALDYLRDNTHLNVTDRASVQTAITNLRSGSTSETVSLAGETFTNVKDANDYVERLKASGASVAVIADAEDTVSALVNDYIDRYKTDANHAIGSMWAQNDKLYQVNEQLMSSHHVSRATDADSLKKQIGKANSAATVIRANARSAQRNDAYAKAKGSGK